jgi:hypothetical protein
MESQNLKRTFFLVAFMLTLVGQNGFAQKSSWQVDKLRVGTGSTFGYLPTKVKALQESEEGTGRYEMQEITTGVGNILLQAEVVVPFYRTPSWSVGAKVGAALGFQYASEEVEELNGAIVYDFPQFLYYRNYKTVIDFTVLAGYKYTKSPLSTHFALGGLELQVTEEYSVRFYASLNSHKYYQLYTDGREEPMITLREFGISILKSF